MRTESDAHKALVRTTKMRTQFPEKEWLSALLLDEWRETYYAMTEDQKRLVRLAWRYGEMTTKDKDRGLQ